MEKRTATLIVKMTRNEHDLMKHTAIERGVTLSHLVRQALRKFLETYCK